MRSFIDLTTSRIAARRIEAEQTARAMAELEQELAAAKAVAISDEEGE